MRPTKPACLLVAVLFVSACAQNGPTQTATPVSAATMSPVDTAVVPSVAVPAPSPAVAPVVAAQPQPAATKPAAPKPPASKPTVKTYHLYPSATWTKSDTYSQGLIDQGRLVTWSWSPRPCILAGHDTMGWAWLDNIPTSSYVVVHSGPCAGRYVVMDHRWISGHGSPGQPSFLNGYAALQTCAGSGTGFSLMRRA